MFSYHKKEKHFNCAQCELSFARKQQLTRHVKDVHDKGFENDLERKMGDIVSYLKKEFKKITKKTLNLKSLGDVDALVQQTSRVRVFVVATKTYEVGNLSSVDAVEGDTTVKNTHRNFQDFLAEGAWKA